MQQINTEMNFEQQMGDAELDFLVQFKQRFGDKHGLYVYLNEYLVGVFICISET